MSLRKNTRKATQESAELIGDHATGSHQYKEVGVPLSYIRCTRCLSATALILGILCSIALLVGYLTLASDVRSAQVHATDGVLEATSDMHSITGGSVELTMETTDEASARFYRNGRYRVDSVTAGPHKIIITGGKVWSGLNNILIMTGVRCGVTFVVSNSDQVRIEDDGGGCISFDTPAPTASPI